jgi:hypothetical protein
MDRDYPFEGKPSANVKVKSWSLLVSLHHKYIWSSWLNLGIKIHLFIFIMVSEQLESIPKLHFDKIKVFQPFKDRIV